MEVLLWLAPAVVVTAVAMAWAGWAGRQRRETVDRDEAVRRLGAALERPGRTPGYAVPVERDRTTERSTGVAVRRSSTRAAATPEPVVEPVVEKAVEPVTEATPPPHEPPAHDDQPHRRAS